MRVLLARTGREVVVVGVVLALVLVVASHSLATTRPTLAGLAGLVVSTSEAPPGFSRLPDSGAKSLVEAWPGGPKVRAAMRRAGFLFEYVADYGLSRPASGRIYSTAVAFASPMRAKAATALSAAHEARGATSTARPAPEVGPNGVRVDAYLNGVVLYGFYWTDGSVALSLLVRGKPSNVSPKLASMLVVAMNNNVAAPARATTLNIAGLPFVAGVTALLLVAATVSVFVIRSRRAAIAAHSEASPRFAK